MIASLAPGVVVVMMPMIVIVPTPGMGVSMLGCCTLLPPPPQPQKLRHQHVEPHQRNHGVAHAFQLIGPGGELQARRVEGEEQHAHERDRGQRLHRRRDERDDDPAPRGLLVRHYVRRDDRLAVARPDRVQNAVDKAESGQRQRGGQHIFLLETLHRRCKLALQALLLRGNPPKHTRAERRLLRRGTGSRRTKGAWRVRLSPCRVPSRHADNAH
jgi:hypothetical protein